MANKHNISQTQKQAEQSANLVPPPFSPTVPRIPVIGLYVPTRGRHQLCASTLNAWAQLAADTANIRFMMGVDEDDPDANHMQASELLQVDKFGSEVITCGGRVKQLSNKLDVDIYLAIVDYYYPLTQYWDQHLRQAMSGGHEIVNVYFAAAPTAFHVTACSKRWMDLANKYEPEIFPFWFSDAWRLETHCYVFNTPPETIQSVQVGGSHHSRTHNMHDIDFWWGLFHALRPRRLREAYEIYKGYGLSCPTFQEFVSMRRDKIDMFIRVDMAKRKAQLANYQQDFGQMGEPSEKYKRCKDNAEELIKTYDLTLWEMKWG